MARLTDEQRLEQLLKTEEQLKAKKKAVQARLRSKENKIRNRRCIIIGAVMEAHAEHDPEFHDYLWTILKNRVIRETDREFLGLPPLKKDPRG